MANDADEHIVFKEVPEVDVLHPDFVPGSQRKDNCTPEQHRTKMDKIERGVRHICRERKVPHEHLEDLLKCVELVRDQDHLPFQWDTSLYASCRRMQKERLAAAVAARELANPAAPLAMVETAPLAMVEAVPLAMVVAEPAIVVPQPDLEPEEIGCPADAALGDAVNTELNLGKGEYVLLLLEAEDGGKEWSVGQIWSEVEVTEEGWRQYHCRMWERVNREASFVDDTFQYYKAQGHQQGLQAVWLSAIQDNIKMKGGGNTLSKSHTLQIAQKSHKRVQFWLDRPQNEE